MVGTTGGSGQGGGVKKTAIILSNPEEPAFLPQLQVEQLRPESKELLALMEECARIMQMPEQELSVEQKAEHFQRAGRKVSQNLAENLTVLGFILFFAQRFEYHTYLGWDASQFDSWCENALGVYKGMRDDALLFFKVWQAIQPHGIGEHVMVDGSMTPVKARALLHETADFKRQLREVQAEIDTLPEHRKAEGEQLLVDTRKKIKEQIEDTLRQPDYIIQQAAAQKAGAILREQNRATHLHIEDGECVAIIRFAADPDSLRLRHRLLKGHFDVLVQLEGQYDWLTLEELASYIEEHDDL